MRGRRSTPADAAGDGARFLMAEYCRHYAEVCKHPCCPALRLTRAVLCVDLEAVRAA